MRGGGGGWEGGGGRPGVRGLGGEGGGHEESKEGRPTTREENGVPVFEVDDVALKERVRGGGAGREGGGGGAAWSEGAGGGGVAGEARCLVPGVVSPVERGGGKS